MEHCFYTLFTVITNISNFALALNNFLIETMNDKSIVICFLFVKMVWMYFTIFSEKFIFLLIRPWLSSMLEMDTNSNFFATFIHFCVIIFLLFSVTFKNFCQVIFFLGWNINLGLLSHTKFEYLPYLLAMWHL